MSRPPAKPSPEPQQPSLPSGKIAHATTFHNEMQGRLHSFRSGIEALTSEMEGQQAEYTAEREKLDAEHQVKKGDLLRRIEDMRNGEAMALAAIDIWNRTQEPAPEPPQPLEGDGP